MLCEEEKNIQLYRGLKNSGDIVIGDCVVLFDYLCIKNPIYPEGSQLITQVTKSLKIETAQAINVYSSLFSKVLSLAMSTGDILYLYLLLIVESFL